MRQSEDYTIFASKAEFSNSDYRGLFAHSPAELLRPKQDILRPIEADYPRVKPVTLTSRGLLINSPVMRVFPADKTYLAWVCSSRTADNDVTPQGDTIICVWLREIRSSPWVFARISPDKLETRPKMDMSKFTEQTMYILPSGTVNPDPLADIGNTRSGIINVHFPLDIGPELFLTRTIKTFGDFKGAAWIAFSKTISYSYREGNCALAALRFESVGEFIVLVGFCDDLPCCSIVTSGDTDFPTTLRWEEQEAVNKFFDNIIWPHTGIADRAAKSLPTNSTITAVIRVGPLTRSDLAVFNLHI